MLQTDPAALGLIRVSERDEEQHGQCWDLGAHAAWSSNPCFCSRFNLDWAYGSMLSHIWLWWCMWYLACSEVLSFSDKANWQLWGPAKDVWGCCCATAIAAVPLLAVEERSGDVLSSALCIEPAVGLLISVLFQMMVMMEEKGCHEITTRSSPSLCLALCLHLSQKVWIAILLLLTFQLLALYPERSAPAGSRQERIWATLWWRIGADASLSGCSPEHRKYTLQLCSLNAVPVQAATCKRQSPGASFALCCSHWREAPCASPIGWPLLSQLWHPSLAISCCPVFAIGFWGVDHSAGSLWPVSATRGARMRGGGMESCCAAWQGKVAAVHGSVPCDLLADLPAETPRFWSLSCSGDSFQIDANKQLGLQRCFGFKEPIVHLFCIRIAFFPFSLFF